MKQAPVAHRESCKAVPLGFPKVSIRNMMKAMENTSHQHMALEASSWPKPSRCTLLTEQPQIGAIITESRDVVMTLIINHFPVCLRVTIVSEHRALATLELC